jgi:hypothetical protein
MSQPIKDTPILYGEDARRFRYNMEHPKKLSDEVLERMKRNYEKFCNISDFWPYNTENNNNMKTKVKKAVEKYQCCGCTCGSNAYCFTENPAGGVGCGKHSAGTYVFGVGAISLGLPFGFNRYGVFGDMKPNIFEIFEDEYDIYNVPVWKYRSKDGHTVVRGLIPRRNEPFLHIFLEDCMDKINCAVISQELVDYMD